MPGIPKNKANATARYQFELGRYNSFVQGSWVYQSGTTYSLENTASYAGTTAAFSVFNLSAGIAQNSWSLEAYIEKNRSPRDIATSLRLPLELVQDLVRKINLAEYKRQQAAPGLKVTSKAFGIGRRYPIAQRFSE